MTLHIPGEQMVLTTLHPKNSNCYNIGRHIHTTYEKKKKERPGLQQYLHLDDENELFGLLESPYLELKPTFYPAV